MNDALVVLSGVGKTDAVGLVVDVGKAGVRLLRKRRTARHDRLVFERGVSSSMTEAEDWRGHDDESKVHVWWARRAGKVEVEALEGQVATTLVLMTWKSRPRLVRR